MNIKYEKSWNELFAENEQLLNSIKTKIDWDKQVFPNKENIFRVFKLPIDKIRVVILGQDPYHNEGQADGLAFSVPSNTKLPPSLRNIFLAIKHQLGIEIDIGDLSHWFEQGVFLSNTALTVEKNKPGSHANIGWHKFIKKTIEFIDEKQTNVLFILWGNNAKKFKKHIKNNASIDSVHPSPLSFYRGFIDNFHFKEIDEHYEGKFMWKK